MTSSDPTDVADTREAADRHAFVRYWADYVRTHDDAEWSRQQNVVIDSQLESANELAAAGATDPTGFFERLDRRRRFPPHR